MAFFVPPKKLEENQSEKKHSTDIEIEIQLIAMSKRIRVTKEELKDYTIQDFLNIYNAYYGRDESSENKKVMSSPAEIEDFLLRG
jgi:hypothetical protein